MVVLAKPDLIDKLGVAVVPSIPFQAPIVRSRDRRFRFLPEPSGASARDPPAPPSTRHPAALRQATETDTGGSVTLGLAVRRLERLAVQRLYRQSRDRHRLAPERLPLVRVAKTSFDPEDSLSNGAALPMLRGTCSSPGQTAADGEKTVGKNRLWRPGRHRPPFPHELRGPVERRRQHSGARPQKNNIESRDASELYAASRQLYR